MHTNKKRNGFLTDMKIKAQKIQNAVLKYPNGIKSLSVETKDKLQGKVSETVAKQTQKMIDKAGVGPESTVDNLRKYCRVVNSLIGMAKYDPSGGAVSKIRSQMLTEMPLDIYEFFSGKQKLADIQGIPTREQVINFYWNVIEFRDIWQKLGLNKDMLDVMVDEDAAKAAQELDKVESSII